MEDLLFHTQTVVQQVCECAGGHLVASNSTNANAKVQLPRKAAKDHGNATRNGYLESLIRASNPERRLQKFTAQDLAYARYHLDEELLNEFRYSIPS